MTVALILAAIAVLLLGIFGVVFVLGKRKGGAGKRDRGREVILKEANKRLAQNPRDLEALKSLGDLYFREESWNEALKTYEILVESGSGNPALDQFEANLRYGIAANKLGLLDEAAKGFATARTYNPNNFELNYNLGALEFQRKNYDKAIPLLQQARTQQPDHAPTLRTLGHSFFRVKKFKESMAFIRKAIDLSPDDKESLYTLAECYFEASQTEQALRIFSHLRADPQMGPNACLYCGTINISNHQNAAAIADLELGLKHQSVKPDVLLELKYRLATVYLQEQEMGRALALLREIQATNASYKDVSLLISKYQELNANKNLQVYMMAPAADFVALCRKMVMNYYQRAKVKVSNIVSSNDWVDILAEVDTSKWSDVVMFRFIRTQGSIGELILRDFHSHLKEHKAGKGICITVGKFTDEAKRYTEARLIDLIDKEQLTGLLNAVDARASRAAAAAAAAKKK